MNHELHTITITFIACEGMNDKVLEEIRVLREHIEKNSLDHASNKKVKVDHIPATEQDMRV